MPDYLLGLLQLTDPALPVGGFSHSAGLETYVQQGLVKDRPSADAWIRQMLRTNLACNDAAFMSLAYDAAAAGNLPALLDLDEQCTALKTAREIREASHKLGLRLIKIFRDLQPCATANAYAQAIQTQAAAGHYCIVFGVYAQALAIPKTEALTAFYYNAAAGMVTNCVKLVPLGQLDGQQVLFQLQPLIRELVTLTLRPAPALLGRCSVGFDIRSMQHERLYSRLYMS
ncbi:MAG TPA: urease accessory protein UreF [Chitinophaga sp.]